jgi:hypothetical protein
MAAFVILDIPCVGNRIGNITTIIVKLQPAAQTATPRLGDNEFSSSIELQVEQDHRAVGALSLNQETADQHKSRRVKKHGPIRPAPSAAPAIVNSEEEHWQ